MIVVEKKEVCFGAADAAATGSPGAPWREGSYVVQRGGQSPLHDPYRMDDLFPGAGGTPVSQKLNFSRRHGDGPVRMISVAPDSLVHCARMRLAGSDSAQDFLLSPQTPWIGDLGGSEFALLAPILPWPSLIQAAGTAFQIFDARETPDSTGISFAFPFRVHLHRDDCGGWPAPPAPSRAPMAAVFTTDGTTAIHQFLAIVDGRQRIDIHTLGVGAGAYTVGVTGQDGVFNTFGATPQIGVDSVVLDPGTAVASFGTYVRSYQGNPFQLILVSINGAGVEVAVTIRAWDF